MKMWSIKVITLLLFCYARPLTGKVYFVSENFNNTLHWDPLESTSLQEKVLYSVQYKSDNMDGFQIKKECQNITALSCDLTAETASIYDIQYEAQVFVNNTRYGKTTRFKPLAETVFGPPQLSVDASGSSLVVKVSLPPGPDGVSIANIINRSTNGHSKNIIIYTLNITKPHKAEVLNTKGQFVISLEENEAEYCGDVFYNTLSEWGRSQSQKASFCYSVTRPGDYTKLLPWLLTGVGLLAVIILVLVLYMWNYAKVGKQTRMPQSLVKNLHTPQKVLPAPFEEPHISRAVTVCTSSRDNATDPVGPKVPPVGPETYSPQDLIFQDSSGSSVDAAEHTPTLNPQDTSAQSGSYSAVVVHAPADQDERTQRPTAGGPTYKHPQMFFTREPRDTATEDDPAEPLMLDIKRSPSGQLILSSLASLMQSRTGDEAAPLPSEKKPLLWDLVDAKAEAPSLASLQSFDSSEWSDSGCDDSNLNTPTIYSPSQAIFESGYKQNWIPGVFLGDVSKDSFNHQRNFP